MRRSGPTVALASGQSCEGGQSAAAHLARDLPQPSIYFAQNEVEAGLAGKARACTLGYLEDDFNALLGANVTGSLVASSEAADILWIPFPSTCNDNKADDTSGALFRHAWEAVKSMHTHFATLCARPWMERTNFGMQTRDFLQQ